MSTEAQCEDTAGICGEGMLGQRDSRCKGQEAGTGWHWFMGVEEWAMEGTGAEVREEVGANRD